MTWWKLIFQQLLAMHVCISHAHIRLLQSIFNVYNFSFDAMCSFLQLSSRIRIHESRMFIIFIIDVRLCLCACTHTEHVSSKFNYECPMVVSSQQQHTFTSYRTCIHSFSCSPSIPLFPVEWTKPKILRNDVFDCE